MYNMLYGKNPDANPLLISIGIDATEIPRLRNVFDGIHHVFVFTRCGPSNRGHDCSDDDKTECWECMAEKLEAKPNFVNFYGNENDRTYGTFKFKKDINDYSDPFGRELGFDNHFLDCQKKPGCTGVRKPFKILIGAHDNCKWVFCYCRVCKTCTRMMFKPTNNLGTWCDEPHTEIDVTCQFTNEIKNEN